MKRGRIGRQGGLKKERVEKVEGGKSEGWKKGTVEKERVEKGSVKSVEKRYKTYRAVVESVL